VSSLVTRSKRKAIVN